MRSTNLFANTSCSLIALVSFILVVSSCETALSQGAPDERSPVDKRPVHQPEVLLEDHGRRRGFSVFSPSGDKFAAVIETTDNSDVVCVWNTSTGKLIDKYDGIIPDQIRIVPAFNNDELTVIETTIGYAPRNRILSLKPGSSTPTSETPLSYGLVGQASVSTDERLVAIPFDKVIRVYETRDLGLKHTIKCANAKGLQWTDGGTKVVAGTNKGDIVIVDVETERIVEQIPSAKTSIDRISSSSKTGMIAALSGDQKLSLIDLKTTPLQIRHCSLQYPLECTFVKNDTELVVFAEITSGTIVWRISTEDLKETSHVKLDGVEFLALSSDGRWAGFKDGSIKIYQSPQ